MTLIVGNISSEGFVSGTTVSATSITSSSISATTISATTFYGNAANLTGGTDVYITGGTPNNGLKTYVFTNNTGGTFTVNGLTDINITAGTFNSSAGTTTFTNTTGGTFSVTGLTTGDTYVTGFTYNNANQFTLSSNQNKPNLTATINTVTGLTVNGNIDMSAAVGNILLGGGILNLNTGNGIHFIEGANEFTGDIYLQADDAYLSFKTDNVDRLSIGHAGGVGINTTNPLYSLDVKGSIRIEEDQLFNFGGYTDLPDSVYLLKDASNNFAYGVGALVVGVENGLAIYDSIVGSTRMQIRVDSATTVSYIGLNVGASTTTKLLLAGSNSSASATRWITGLKPTGATAGDWWLDTTMRNFGFFSGLGTGGTTNYLQGNFCENIANATVVNTTGETTLVGTLATNSIDTIPINFFVVGRSFKITSRGFFSTSASTPGTLTVRLQSVSSLPTTVNLAVTPTFTVPSGVTNKGWETDAILTCRSIGTGGTFVVDCLGFKYLDQTGTTINCQSMQNSSTVSFDTTRTEQIRLTAQWGTATTANTITCSTFKMDLIR